MPWQRIEQAFERLSEDETLFADLEDAGATALRGWIERELIAAADAADFDVQVDRIRRAARTAARSDGDPVAVASAALAAGPGSSRQAPARSKEEARRAAVARLLAPSDDPAASPAAALLSPAPAAPAAQRAPETPAAQARPAKPWRREQSRQRRSRWRYRKAS